MSFVGNASMRLVRRCGCGLLLLGMLAACPAAVAKGDPLAEAETLFDQGDAHKALSLLKNNIRRRADTTSLRCRIRMASYYCSAEDFEQALKLLEKYAVFSDLKKLGPDYRACLEAFGEHAFVAGANGDIYRGLKRLDLAHERTNGLDNAIVSYYRAKLLHRYAKQQEAQGHLRHARESAQESLKSHDSPSSSGGGEEQRARDLAFWRYFEPKLATLEMEVDFSLFAMEYGEDYALYRMARQYHLKNQHRKASGIYERVAKEFPDGVFADASRCYRIECLLKDSDWSYDKVEKEALSFVEQDPNGLYREEVLAYLGRAAANTYLNFDLAEKHYRRAFDLCNRHLELAENQILCALPDKIKTIAVNPQPVRSYTKTFFAFSRPEKAEELLNRDTNPTYLPELRKECGFWLGLFRFADGDFAGADELFVNSSNSNPDLMKMYGQKIPNVLSRLRGACKQEFFYLTKEEMARFSRNQRIQVLLADFQFCNEQWEPAYARYQALMPLNPGKADDQACLLLIRQFNCLCFLRKREAAGAALKQALELAGKDVGLRTHVLYAMGQHYDSMDYPEESHASYREAATIGKGTLYGRWAHYSLMTSVAIRGDVDKATKILEEFCDIYRPTAEQVEEYRQILATLREREGEARKNAEWSRKNRERQARMKLGNSKRMDSK
jgi:TolA-binding protein